MTTTIGPALGHGPWTQQGTGTTPGYDAIDVRRLLQGVAAEGILSAGGYAVTQRGAGANMSVDIAASTGEGARVQGDAVTLQGLYYVPPASAVINETISTADATNPRNDLVILEIKDTQHDASGSNLAQTRVVTGTPNASATQTDALGVNGTPSLPASAIALAVVNVPATDTSITTSQVDDRRPFVWRGGSGGKSIIATAEARTNTAYGKLTTPDLVKGIVLPTDGIICVMYDARWQESVAGVARAAIFLNSNQLDVAYGNIANGHGVEAAATGSTDINIYGPLATCPIGLIGLDVDTTAVADPVTTGRALGFASSNGVSQRAGFQVGASSVDSMPIPGGSVCFIDAAAGTYDISVQFKSSSGTVTVKDRKLWCWAIGFG